jgi:hypothetical protein
MHYRKILARIGRFEMKFDEEVEELKCKRETRV